MAKSRKPYPSERRWVLQTRYGDAWVTYTSSDDPARLRLRSAKELGHYRSDEKRIVENVPA